jgi:hypothetical protein
MELPITIVICHSLLMFIVCLPEGNLDKYTNFALQGPFPVGETGVNPTRWGERIDPYDHIVLSPSNDKLRFLDGKLHNMMVHLVHKCG